jgi:hypothetical protein
LAVPNRQVLPATESIATMIMISVSSNQEIFPLVDMRVIKGFEMMIFNASSNYWRSSVWVCLGLGYYKSINFSAHLNYSFTRNSTLSAQYVPPVNPYSEGFGCRNKLTSRCWEKLI